MALGKIKPDWYDSHIRFYTGIALDALKEAPATDDAVAEDVHQWLNAPDSMLQSWGNDVEDIERARSIIEHSQHPNRPVLLPFANDNLSRYSGENPPDADQVWRLQYIAAHVIVRDVMCRIGRTYTMPADVSLLEPVAP